MLDYACSDVSFDEGIAVGRLELDCAVLLDGVGAGSDVGEEGYDYAGHGGLGTKELWW